LDASGFKERFAHARPDALCEVEYEMKLVDEASLPLQRARFPSPTSKAHRLV